MGTHLRLGLPPGGLITMQPFQVPTGGGGPYVKPTITNPGGIPMGPTVTQPPTDPSSGMPPMPLPPIQVPPPIPTGSGPPPVSIFAPPDQGGASSGSTMPPVVAPTDSNVVGLSPLGMFAIGAIGLLFGIGIYGAIKHHEVKAA